jgi:hypothetical protein
MFAFGTTEPSPGGNDWMDVGGKQLEAAVEAL